MTGAHRSRQRDVGIYRRWEDTLVDAALHASEDAVLEFGHERELLVFPADAWHVSIQEHEREVLRLLLAELVEAPDRVANVLQRIGRSWRWPARRRQAGGSLLRRGRKRWRPSTESSCRSRPGLYSTLAATLRIETLRVAVGDEEPEGGVENGAAGLFVGLLPTLAPPEAAGGQASHDGGSN